jgi:hypothetical protein
MGKSGTRSTQAARIPGIEFSGSRKGNASVTRGR